MHLFQVHHLKRYYQKLQDQDLRGDAFLQGLLAAFEMKFDLPAGEERHIPATGPAIVVANLPLGVADGLILLAIIRRYRQDARLLVAGLELLVPELADLIIPGDNPSPRGRTPFSVGGLRRAVKHLQGGGLLVVFPSGTGSRFDLLHRRVTDPRWRTGVVRLARLSQAAVVPAHIHGKGGGPVAQLASVGSRRLRTWLAPQMLLTARGHSYHVRLGQAVPPRRIMAFTSDREAVEYLRFRCYLLGGHEGPKPFSFTPFPFRLPRRPACDLVGPHDRNRLAAELAALPPDQELLRNGDVRVVYLRAAQAPLVMQEIGRLRELTFRAAGEGTGKSLDLTPHDDYYLQLVVWNGADRDIVGAYRLGLSEEILPQYGVHGFYSDGLFRYRPGLFEHLRPAVELGRSWVQPRYQRNYNSLLLLWKGIGAFIARFPRYRFLFGPVSISKDYSSVSRQLLVSFLRDRLYDHELGRFVRPRHPFRLKPLTTVCPDAHVRLTDDLGELSDWLSDIELDGKGVPVLIRQYAKLGGRVAAFNVDPDFGEVVDGLLVVDLLAADDKLLKKYLGPEGAAGFRAYHASATDSG